MVNQSPLWTLTIIEVASKSTLNVLTNLPSTLPWPRIWSGLLTSITAPRKKEVIWHALHGSLKVRDSLVRWGYRINTRACAVCGEIENLRHCLIACLRVSRIWAYFLPTLTKIDPTFQVSLKHVLLKVYCSSDTVRKKICLITETIVYWIWTARNSATFRNNNAPAQTIIRQIILDLG